MDDFSWHLSQIVDDVLWWINWDLTMFLDRIYDRITSIFRSIF